MERTSSNKKEPTYTHKLIRLAEECNLYKLMSEEQKEFIFIVTPLNIETRYPTQKKDIFESLSEEKCKDIISKTEEMMIWTKKKLEN